MTTGAELLSLAERVESAGGADQRDLLEEAFLALYPDVRIGTREETLHDRFVAMLDAEAYESAALTLAPAFPHLVLVRELWNGPGTENGKSTMATVQRYGETMWTGDFTGLASTPATAITAACLRARAALAEQS